MISSKNNRKDKGKWIRRAEDYQLEVPVQLPTHNQFQTLAQFPPLPYKSFITKPLINQLLTMPMLFDTLNFYFS